MTPKKEGPYEDPTIEWVRKENSRAKSIDSEEFGDGRNHSDGRRGKSKLGHSEKILCTLIPVY